MKNEKCKINEYDIPESNFKLEKPKWYSKVKENSTEALSPNIQTEDNRPKDEKLTLVIEEFTKDKIEIEKDAKFDYNSFIIHYLREGCFVKSLWGSIGISFFTSGISYYKTRSIPKSSPFFFYPFLIIFFPSYLYCRRSTQLEQRKLTEAFRTSKMK
eukprot:gene12308-5982_t